MSPPEGSQAPLESRGTQRNSFVHAAARKHNAAIEPLNTDTLGDVSVYSGNGSTLLTTQAVAVVLAPGGPIGAQTRSATLTALCPVTGTIIAQSRCASNYLESASGINNATASGPNISAPLAEISR